jgi:hypothetical protein
MRETERRLVGTCAGCGKEFFLGEDRRVPEHALRGSPGRCPASNTPALYVHEVRD